MKMAIKDVKEGMSIRGASNLNKVNKSALARPIKDGKVYEKKGGKENQGLGAGAGAGAEDFQRSWRELDPLLELAQEHEPEKSVAAPAPGPNILSH